VLRIGIVGAENSHSRAIAKTLNVKKTLPGVRVTAIWGEKRKWAEAVAAETQIPRVVRRPAELIGLADGAVVDHRHGKFHLPAALPLLRARMPLFIDKPLCCSVSQGRRFLAEAARRRVPVVSFSTMPLQADFAKLKKEIAGLGRLLALVTSGPADLYSKYGGVFFYGVHQVEMALRIAGLEVTHAQVNRSGKGGTATLWYADGLVVTMNLLGRGSPGFHVLAVGEKGTVARLVASDADPYLPGIRSWVRAFRGGRVEYTAREMLAPVAVLAALQKSFKAGGRKVRVAKV
jgi:predicted dehydrogenase